MKSMEGKHLYVHRLSPCVSVAESQVFTTVQGILSSQILYLKEHFGMHNTSKSIMSGLRQVSCIPDIYLKKLPPKLKTIIRLKPSRVYLQFGIELSLSNNFFVSKKLLAFLAHNYIYVTHTHIKCRKPSVYNPTSNVGFERNHC